MKAEEENKKQLKNFVKAAGIIAVVIVVALVGFRIGYNSGLNHGALVIETELAKESANCENNNQSLVIKPIIQNDGYYALNSRCSK